MYFNFKKLSLALLSGCFLIQTVQAMQEEGLQEFQKGNNIASYKLAKKHKTVCDIKNAVHFYKLAAEQGNSKAKFQLTRLYEDAFEQVKTSLTEDELFNLVTKEPCHSGALLNLAVKYHLPNKQDIQPNYKKAASLYQMALQRGETVILNQLVMLCKEHKEARKFLSINELYGLVEIFDRSGGASFTLGEMLMLKKRLEPAFNLFKKSANFGNPKAMEKLADMYEKGEGVEQNKKEAERLRRNAKENSKNIWDEDFVILKVLN